MEESYILTRYSLSSQIQIQIIEIYDVIGAVIWSDTVVILIHTIEKYTNKYKQTRSLRDACVC